MAKSIQLANVSGVMREDRTRLLHPGHNSDDIGKLPMYHLQFVLPAGPMFWLSVITFPSRVWVVSFWNFVRLPRAALILCPVMHAADIHKLASFTS